MPQPALTPRFRRGRRGRATPLLAVAAAIVTFAASVVAGGASSASAADTASAPSATSTYYAANGLFAFTGHGYGHGHGLSQWGAYGAATQGLNAAQILDFYYPGTTPAEQGNPTVRVWITGDEGSDVQVVPSARTGALSVVDHADADRTIVLPATVPLPTPPGTTPPVTPVTVPVTAWRAAATGTGTTVLQGFWSGSWQPYPQAANWASTGSIEFTAATGRITLVNPDGTQRDYAGSLAAVPNGKALITVNTVPAESYLRSVVPAESPSSWPAAALQAQAIAARTYAASVAKPTATSDICDTTACQVYNGLAAYSATGALTRTYTAASTDVAVSSTAGQIRTYGGAPIFAQFSSADGGWTVAGTSSQPYLQAKADPYDGVVPNGAHDWTQNVSAATIGKAFGVGTAQSLTVLGRDGNGDWGGRVTSVRVAGTAGSVTVAGTAFAAALGLRSTWWTAPVGQQLVHDLYGVVLTGTSSGKVELHALTQTSNYQQYGLHAATAFDAIAPSQLSDWRFLIAPFNGSGRPDLFGVHLRHTATGHVEVHVLSAVSGYRTFVLHVATPYLAIPAGQGIDVQLGSFDGDGKSDLFLLPWSDTGSKQVEVHVLPEASSFHTFVMHAATALPEDQVTAGAWHFVVGDGAGAGDLVGIKQAATGSGDVEVHILSRASKYSAWSLHTATGWPLPLAGSVTWFDADETGDGVRDIVGALTTGTASGHTEVHALSGSSFASFGVHLATAFGPVPAETWQLALG